MPSLAMYGAKTLIPALGLGIGLVCCEPAPETSPAVGVRATNVSELLDRAQVVDLTHPFGEETIYWPTEAGFQLETRFEGTTDGGYFYEANVLTSPEHGGTHLDAPVHFAEGRQSVDEIPLDRLRGPAVVVDVSEAAAADADYRVTVADLEAWEGRHGVIPDGAILLIHTGFSARWPDRTTYMGTDLRGEAGVAALHFPGLHPDAATWLVEERNIDAVGLDTPSIDYGQSKDFATHRILFAENVPAFENVAHLDRLPPTGSYVVALPMQIRSGSGAPLRIMAFLPDGAAAGEAEGGRR